MHGPELERPRPLPAGSVVPGRQSRHRTRSYRVAQVPWVYVVPALAVYAFVVLYPTLAGAVYAFTTWNGLSPQVAFNGLANFTTFFHDAEALAGLKHTLEYALIITLVQVPLGLLLALAVNARLKTRQVLRLIFFTPVVFVTIVVAFTWQFLYTPGGPLNTVLGGAQIGWLGDPHLVLFSVAAVSIWQFVGYTMVVFLAGMQGVAVELYEAAALDGAGPWQRFWGVTFPSIAPATTINVLLTLTGTLKIFDQPFAMTGGGPGTSSNSLATVLYGQAFVQGNYGYGTAIGLVLVVLVTGISLPALLWLRSFEVAG